MSLQHHTLSNGLKIITEHMPGLKSASLGIWVKAGARNERIEQNGIAHFLEHMAFKGTKSRNALEIAEAIENVGGYINAYTSREMTAYYVRVLEENVGLGLEIIADIVQNSVFHESDIEVERGVILQEIGQAADTPDDIIFDWLQETAYPDQAIGRPILGPSERVAAFQRSDFTDLIGEHYHPSEMILSASGAVDHDRFVRQAESLFQSQAPKTPRPNQQAALFHSGEKRVQKPLEQVHFALSFESPSYLEDALYTAQVYSAILGGGMSARLFQELREKHGLCYTVFAQTGAYRDTGSTTIYAGTSRDKIAQLMTTTVDELRKMSHNITAAEVDRARAQMKAGLLMGLESPSARTERLACVLSIWGKAPDLQETIDKIDAVDMKAVQSFAAQLCGRSKLAIALYGEIDGSPHVSELEERLRA